MTARPAPAQVDRARRTTEAGSYEVDLTVTDGEGATGTVTRTVTVAVPHPVEIVPVEPDVETTPMNHVR